ncbi:hypothetical protein HDU76_010086, partial [Blyttiomyces sp. JEL0837]
MAPHVQSKPSKEEVAAVPSAVELDIKGDEMEMQDTKKKGDASNDDAVPTTTVVVDEENVIRDGNGNIMDGRMTKDKVIVKWAIVVLIILVISWTAQWVGFALPYWRSDQYHNGGLFQICGSYNWKFDPSAQSGAGTIIPVSKASDHWCNDAKDAADRIGISRGFEATSTVMSMVFGTTTLWFVVFPDKDPAVASRNGVLALIGIFLTPWLCVIDFFISVNYWDHIGVGYFEQDGNNFLAAAGQMLIACTFVDLVVQYSFLRWGVMRHNWKVPGTTFGVGGSGSMGGSRAA